MKNLNKLPENINVKKTLLKPEDGIVFFSDNGHPFSNQFPKEVMIEGINFTCAQ